MELFQTMVLLYIPNSVILNLRYCSTDYGHLKIDYENRLEFQLSDGTWGTVCSKGFDSYAASAACKQLGYTTYNSYYSTE